MPLFPVPESPVDGKKYARQDRGWATVSEAVHVTEYGAVGDGIADDSTAIQTALAAAVAAGADLVFDPGTYLIETTVTVASGMRMQCNGDVTITGAAIDGIDLFTVTGGDVVVDGGHFTTCLRAIFITSANDITVRNASFASCVNAVYASSVTSTGSFTVDRCTFAAMETGVGLQSQGLFANIRVSECEFTALAEQTLAARPSPLDKKIVSGIWTQQTLDANCNVICSGNFVDDVTGPSVSPTKVETHGIAVMLLPDFETDCILSNNTVRNTYDDSLDGSEGMMGRARRVIIEGNILFNAGAREGCIYAKGTVYHKILGNTIEVATDHSDVANTRGIISTGVSAEVRGNKFVNLAQGIRTRALAGYYTDNEFINCITCVNMALEDGAAHVTTMISDCTADAACTNFFSDETSGIVTYGDLVLRGNMIYGAGICANMKGGRNFEFMDNYVYRNNLVADASKTLLNTNSLIGTIVVRNNHFAQFDNLTGNQGRILTGSTANTPRVIVENNLIENGYVAFWMQDQTYVDYIFRNNQFYNCAASFLDSNITVSGIHVADDVSVLSFEGATSLKLAGTNILKWNADGKIEQRPPSTATPTENGDMVFEATNNTTITVRYKGSDGTVRSGTIALT